MITDCQILGIPETTDVSLIKEAYRKRAKELHPDCTSNDRNFQNHFFFVEVCKAYQRLITTGDTTQTVVMPPSDKNKSSSAACIVRHKDQAYVFYKQGIDLLMIRRIPRPLLKECE